MTGIRYSGEFGHPFHVIDDVVILCVDHPFVPEGRVASLMVRDTTLAARLADGFETLWAKAMRDLREISFQPTRSCFGSKRSITQRFLRRGLFYIWNKRRTQRPLWAWKLHKQ